MRASPILFTAFAAFFQSAVAAPAQTADEVFSSELLEFESKGSIGDTYINNSTVVTIVDVSELADDIRDFLASPEVNKRAGVGCPPVTTRETNVDRSGLWWDAWAPASACRGCNLNGAPCHEAFAVSTTVGWSWSTTIDANIVGDALDIIKGAGWLNFDYTWSQSTTHTETWTCDIAAGDRAQVWVQNQHGWADTATRYKKNQCGSISYSGWTFGHANYALAQGPLTVQWGCSSGSHVSC